MQFTTQLIWMGIIMLFTQLIEALAGFGSTAVGLPFAAIFMSTGSASAILNLSSFLVSAWITLTKRSKVNWKEYKKLVLLTVPLLPVGLLIGSGLKAYDAYLKVLLGVIIVFVSLRYFYYTKIKKAAPTALSTAAQYAALVSGAIVHGIFATGGPLITLYTTNKIPEKGEFRSTMCAFWTTVNAVVIVSRIFLGAYTLPVVKLCVYTLPFLAVGVVFGMLIHNRIRHGVFTNVVYYILLAGGLISLYTGFSAIL